MQAQSGRLRSGRVPFLVWVVLAGVAFVLSMMLVLQRLPLGMDSTDRRTMCGRHLVQLGTALLSYARSHNGALPPAYLADPTGRPINSWRTMIFEQMDRFDLFAAYDFREPWNGPRNSKIDFDTYPINFWCPAVQENPTGLTSFLVVTGPHTLFPGDKQVKLEDVKDGPENTILLVTVDGSRIRWNEPRDLTVDEMLLGLETNSNGQERTGISLLPEPLGEINVIFADGSYHRLQEAEITPALLKALITIDGGEDLKALGWKW